MLFKTLHDLHVAGAVDYNGLLTRNVGVWELIQSDDTKLSSVAYNRVLYTDGIFDTWGALRGYDRDFDAFFVAPMGGRLIYLDVTWGSFDAFRRACGLACIEDLNVDCELLVDGSLRDRWQRLTRYNTGAIVKSRQVTDSGADWMSFEFFPDCWRGGLD